MRCREARRLISLYVAPDASWLGIEDRRSLETHVAVCEACRRDCQESRAAIALLRECWQISDDTAGLLRDRGIRMRRESPARIVRLLGAGRAAGWAMAACLCIAVLGSWALLNRQDPSSEVDGVAVSGGEETPLAVASADGAHLAPGAMARTLAGETRHLVISGKHQVVMNAESRLSVESLIETGKTGVLVNLMLGEIFVHVEHEGNPFVVQTAHGRAVITGTTFDVKTTEASTTLVVAEGSVRFESGEGAVQVVAGQQSTIRTAAAPPSLPETCDARALTAWAGHSDWSGQVAQNFRVHDFLLDDLSATPPARTGIQTDLDPIGYARWIEQRRAWFKQQFPRIFDLKDALAMEGVEADYPALLMQSGEIWRFAYPQAALERQVEEDPNGLLRAAAHYDRDKSWLDRHSLLPPLTTRRQQQATGSEAFEHWAQGIAARTQNRSPNTKDGNSLDALNAFLYLVNTRTLAVLETRHGFRDDDREVADEILGPLREEVRILGECMDLWGELSLAWSDASSCDCSDEVSYLAREIERVGALEEKVADSIKLSSPRR